MSLTGFFTTITDTALSQYIKNNNQPVLTTSDASTTGNNNDVDGVVEASVSATPIIVSLRALPAIKPTSPEESRWRKVSLDNFD
jgi:hypothetical protein